MKYIPAITTLLIAIFIFSCKSTQYTPETFPERQVSIGSGGGFAGLYTYYHVLENGQVFKKSSTDSTYTELKKISRNKIKQVFNNYETLNLQDYKIDNPGNMSYYLTFKTDAGSHQMTWGGGQEVDSRIKTIYQIVQSLIEE